MRILLCDDQAIVRARIREALDAAGNFKIVGEASGGISGVLMATELRPDVVLMDVRMPDLGGNEATRQIMAREPHTKVLAFSAESHWSVAEQMFSAGACGYVLKDGELSELLLAIKTVMAGGFFLSPAVDRP